MQLGAGELRALTSATNNSIQKATRVERARQRLAKAIDALDGALGERTAGDAEPDPALAGEIDRLREEIGRLNRDRDQLGEQLDGVIGRLRAVVEG